MAYNSRKAFEALSKKYGVTTQTAPVTQQPKKAAESQLDKLAALKKKYNVRSLEDEMHETGYLTDTPVGNALKVERTTPSSEELRKRLDNINAKITEYQEKAKESENEEWLASISHVTFNDTPGTVEQARARTQTYNNLVQHYQQQRDKVAAELDDTVYSEYMKLADEPDFAAKSLRKTTATGEKENLKGGYVSTAFTDPVYDYINGNEEAEGFIALQESRTGAKALGFDKTKYSQMTADEVAVYNYLYTQGKEKADEYLAAIDKKLSERQAQAEVESIEQNPSAVGRAFEKGFVAAQSGLNSSMYGLAQSMSDEVLPKTQLSHTGAAVRESTSGVGRFAYDTVEQIAHTLPSILTSYAVGNPLAAVATTAKGVKTAGNIGRAAASLVTALTAAGNSYAEYMEKGLTKQQSKTISALIGASEAGLQYLLSGVSAMGGTLTGVKMADKLAGISNGLARVGAKFATSALSEATEEVLQLYVEPIIVAAVTHEEYNLPEREEVIYTALLSAITANFFEAGKIASEETSLRRAGKIVLATDSVQAVIDDAAASDNPAMRRLADKLTKRLEDGKKITAYDLGRIVAESANPDALIQIPEEAAETQTETVEPPAATAEIPSAVGETKSPTQAPEQQTTPLQTQTRTTVAEDGTTKVELPKVINREEQTRAAQKANDPYAGVPEYSPSGLKYTELERSGIASGAAKETIETAKRISAITKRRVLFYDGDRMTGDWARANGAYDNNTIYVNSRSANPVAQIIAHEMTHSIEGTGGYTSFGEYVLNYMVKQGNDLDAMRAAKRKLYGRTDAEFDVDAELVAEFVEKNLLTNEVEIAKMVRSQPSLGRAILNWINGMIAKLPGAKAARERDFLIRARDMYSKALTEAQKRDNGVTSKESTTEQKNTRFLISETLEEDLEKVKNNTFNSANGEVYIGESSDFLTDVIGAEPLSITMPANKAFSAIVSKEEALSDPRYNAKTNYHGLGVTGLVKVLIASETPAAAFVSKPGDKGGRFDRIVLVTDETLNGDALVVVEEVSASAVLEKNRIKANKVITSYDRETAALDVIEARNTGRLLHLDKEKSPLLFAGEPGSNSLTAIQKAELDKNIQNFWANVNWKKSGKTSQVFDDGAQAKTEMAYAFEKAKNKKEQFSISSEAAEQTEQTEEPRSFASFPKKSQKAINSNENRLLNGISELLSVPFAAKRDSLKGIVRNITDIYLENGMIPADKADELFETAYDKGIVVDDEYYNTYKHVKDYLRKTPVVLRAEYRSDMGDYEAFRKSAFGLLNLNNAATRGVDQVYMDLVEMAPELFPEEIMHPADQLQRMYEVANGIRKVENTLDLAHGYNAKEFKEWARQEFNAKLQDYTSDLNIAKRYADSRAKKAEKPVLSAAEASVLYKELKPLKRELEKAVNKNLLTDEDKKQVDRLVRGDILLKHLDPEIDNVRGITEVYEAALKYEEVAAQLREYKRNVKAAKIAAAQEIVGTTTDWEDRKTGIGYSRETAERNSFKVIKDPKKAKALNDAYFKPVHDHEKESTDFKNKFRDRVRSLKLSRKVEKGNTVSESHAVQLLGEAEDNVKYLKEAQRRSHGKDVSNLQRDGKTLADWEAVIENLWITNPNLDKDKITKAVEEFRAIYDELFEMMNEVRVRNGYEPVSYRRGYFPHFQANEDGLLAAFGKALGISTDVVALPTSINGLTHMFKPGIKWFGNALERLGYDTTYDAVQGFDKYIEGVADVIYHTDDIQNLRALASYIRYASGDDGLREQADAIRANPELDEETKEAKIKELYDEGRYALNKYVVWLEEYTNLLAGKKSRNDRQLEDALNRQIYNAAKNLESRVAANMISANVKSWLTNFIPLTQASALVSTSSLLKGMGATLKAYKSDDGIVSRSTFLTNRRGSDPLVQTWAQKTSAALGKGMEIIDAFTADSIVRARYYDNIKKGLSEDAAMSDADSFAASVMADRSKGAMPTLFQQKNPVTKLFTQFQLEVNNQLSYLLKDVPRENREKGLAALAMSLLKFMVSAWLYNEVYEFVIGRRPALDVLGILNDTVGDITGYELPNLVELGKGAINSETPSFETEKGNVIDNLANNILEELPFTTILNLAGMNIDQGRYAVASAIPDLSKIAKALSKDDSGEELTPEEKKARKRAKTQTVLKELAKPATYILPPFGGGQVKRLVEGITAVSRGGSYTLDSEGNKILQYPIYRDNTYETALQALGATVFGKTSLKTGQAWVESGFKSLSAKDTALYQALVDLGEGEENSYNLIREIKAIKKTDTESAAELKRKFLDEADISDAAKTVVYYSMLASDSEKDVLKPLLEDDEKATEATKAILKFYDADSENEKAAAIIGAGLNAEQYIAIRDEYRRLSDVELTANQKAAEFSRWINSQNFTADQKSAIKENFKFYSMMSQDSARYDEFVSAGLSDEAASKLYDELRELTPEDGKTAVSSIQKWNVAVEKVTNEKQLQGVLKSLMTDEQYAAYSEVLELSGISSAQYVKGRTLISQYGSSNEQITWAIQDMASNNLTLPAVGKTKTTLTDKQRAILWQVWTGSTSTKNNPWAKNGEAKQAAQEIADKAKAEVADAKERREAELEAQRKARK